VKRKMLIFLFGLMFCMFIQTCKSPNSPEPIPPIPPIPPKPIKTSDVLEFMYERTLPIIDNSEPDPQGLGVWSDEFSTWTNLGVTYLGNDRWMTEEITLSYSKFPYYAYTIDYKVVFDTAVAETIYARIKGSSAWVKLTNVENVPYRRGKWAKFYLDSEGIRVP